LPAAHHRAEVLPACADFLDDAVGSSDSFSGSLEGFAGVQEVLETASTETAVATTLQQMEAAVAVALEPTAEPTCRAEPENGPYAELAANVAARLSANRSAILMFTSPYDGSGTTETVAGLARAITARIGGEVLAVDGNLRNPGLAAHLGVGAVHGLHDVLIGTARWSDLVRPTAVPRLSVLPAGRPCARGQFTGGTLAWPPLLEELGSQYRLVLLDTASLANPESVPLGACCDGTYLVVGLGRATRRMLRQAARVIQDCQGRLLGCVAIGAG
jgi:Mrp family chromosome partitioning ATPase